MFKSVDPDPTPRSVASDLGLHNLFMPCLGLMALMGYNIYPTYLDT